MKYVPLITISVCCLLVSEAALAERARREFLDRKYAEAEKDSRELTRIDSLNIYAYMSGQIEKARVLLEDAVQQDPEYPLNYYNLACAFAEAGDRDQVLANLALALQHKTKMLKGEQLPDPRSDPSFQKYVRDPEFVKLARGFGPK